MQIAIVGLGRMGGNISRRLMKAGHHCVVFDADVETREALAKDGATATGSLAGVVKALGEKPRVVWVMLPADRITEETIEHLGDLLEPDDVIIDGGNSNPSIFEKSIGEANDCGPTTASPGSGDRRSRGRYTKRLN